MVLIHETDSLIWGGKFKVSINNINQKELVKTSCEYHKNEIIISLKHDQNEGKCNFKKCLDTKVQSQFTSLAKEVQIVYRLFLVSCYLLHVQGVSTRYVTL